ncbi:MAG: DUF3352 domain-containing protein, partial [Anaerolineales bacterium]
ARNLLAGGCGLLILISCCFLVLAGVVIGMDPFDLNLIARLTGRYDAAAEAIPADARMYVGLDLLKLQSEETRRVFRAFAQAVDDPEVQEVEDTFKDLDDELERELGITFTGDVLPWMGRYAGFGVMDVQFDAFGEPDLAEWVFVVAVRDSQAANLFRERFKEGIEKNTGSQFKDEEYRGTTVFELDTTNETNRVAFARFGKLFIFGSGAQSIKKAIDAKKGKSLIDAGDYKESLAELPRERALSFYLSGELLTDLIENFAGAEFGASTPRPSGLRSIILTLSFVDAGIQLDTLTTFAPDQITDIQRQMLENVGAKPTTDGLLPQNTVLYLTGRRLDLVWQNAREQLSSNLAAEDFDESMQLFAGQFGFNPDIDLFPYLDGEWAISMMPSSEGPLASEDIPLGFALIFGTSNPDALGATVDKFGSIIEKAVLTPVETTEVNGQTFYLVTDFGGNLIMTYGIASSQLVIASSENLAGELFAGGSSLADSARYQDVWRAFPSGMNPAFYLDIENLAGTIREGLPDRGRENFDQEFGDVISPIQRLAGASQSLGNDTLRTTFIVFIETTTR